MAIKTTYDNEFEKQLEAAGYKWFEDNWKNSLRGFQKRFRDERGTKYFITGYHWNFGLAYPDMTDYRDQYSFDVQFTIDAGGKSQTIDLRYSADMLPNQWRPVTTLKEVEEFYEKAWKDFGAEYYELNEYT
ncbi:hypothetical protein UFOVP449_238 [uncultured Caudovirales phage]|uniref:Uncharacterized protein n=1 Tax=uncultured Caudovirales phage TaxID=2100421 RepID=A0A6J5MF05_9CAUD|nr:hypothetical protein UFOVP449_238 [uncultured Caudovirales phage]